ncbi:MAG TPA: hypothetical protein VKZ50_06600 [bacterium]|nr:hypothetical protein [bacterium]
MAASQNLIGPQGRLFAERQPGRDAASFRIDNTRMADDQSPHCVLHKRQVQLIPAPRKNVQLHVDPADVVGPATTDAITRRGTIAFHAVGGSGAAKVIEPKLRRGRSSTRPPSRTP